jgi:MFS family permease
MSTAPLAPFSVRSFRFQWPADLATSWAFEMESLILGWYVLSTTGSVQQLVTVAALVWLGSLFSPFLGWTGDRVGVRAILCATRGGYTLCAATLMVLTLSGTLQTWHVFVLAAVNGLMRPSDTAMRNVLIAQTLRPESLMGALGISRTTSDSARIAGAVAGTAGVAFLGMGTAYAVVTALYASAFLLSLGVGGSPPAGRDSSTKVLADMKAAVRYVWSNDNLLGAFCLAFLVNLLAYPFTLGLLPYVAKEVIVVGQSGLGWLAGSFATGGLVGSLVVSAGTLRLRAARVMLWTGAAWFAAILFFGQTKSLGIASGLLFFAGIVQSFCMTPLAAVMLRASSEEMRGRVMGLRMLAIWGLPLGLLASGPLIERLGFSAASLIYTVLGLAATLAIGWRWQSALWHRSAPANAPL